MGAEKERTEEIEITPEMYEAGMDAYLDWEANCKEVFPERRLFLMVEVVYAAMWSVRPHSASEIPQAVGEANPTAYP